IVRLRRMVRRRFSPRGCCRSHLRVGNGERLGGRLRPAHAPRLGHQDVVGDRLKELENLRKRLQQRLDDSPGGHCLTVPPVTLPSLAKIRARPAVSAALKPMSKPGTWMPRKVLAAPRTISTRPPREVFQLEKRACICVGPWMQMPGSRPGAGFRATDAAR